ncbi:vesicle transport through interaction with [Echinococcus multilocularis]|uniref:Vesicle transport through interaction with t-SNAREs homolog 1A n=1 Tax=Echinococcus multilocularis TaxID=6211 RepID=A0A068XZ86_ECHMU|nr:vesicle transport through interaction with [Echinococcus multilocularis]
MASILESYEKQYGNLTSEITAKLNNISRLANDERKAEITATTRLFDETRELLEQMDLEIQDMPADVKPKYTTRLQCYGQELGRLAQEFKRPRYSMNAAPSTGPLSDHGALREELLSGAAADSGDMRASLLTNTERVERTGRRLNEGLRMAYETEEIGGQILDDLDQQRETIQRSRDRLRHANEDLSRSSRLISKMYRRVIQNRAVLAAIGILMCLVFFGIIYIMFFLLSPLYLHPTKIPQEQSSTSHPTLSRLLLPRDFSSLLASAVVNICDLCLYLFVCLCTRPLPYLTPSRFHNLA